MRIYDAANGDAALNGRGIVIPTGKNLTELVSTPVEEPPNDEEDYVVRPLIPRGRITILQGDAGTGKTHLAMALIQAAYDGSTWLGCPVEPQQRIVFFDVESGLDQVKRYLRSYYCERNEQYGRSFHYFDVEPGQFNATFFEEAMRQAGAAHQANELAILDNLSDLTVTGDVNAAHHVSSLLRPIADVCRKHNWTLVCLDYPAKHQGAIAGSESEQQKGTPYGAAVKTWIARSVLQVVLQSKCVEQVRTLTIHKVHCTLRHVKSNFETAKDIQYTLKFWKCEGDSGYWWDIELGATEEHGAAGEVLAAVRENPGQTAAEIGDSLGKTKSWILKILRALEQQRLVESVKGAPPATGGRCALHWYPASNSDGGAQ
ncbi:MAG: hypothetical protein KatS3mg040_1083 [Candidatus Kapaibacterium sp.]|nr:MAG: hypothetical protein KatS3mg040_1083 [Candidatus Kapabacteria bacterium]